MEVKRMRSFCIEVFKTLNGVNPVYMKDTTCRICLEDPMTLKYQELHHSVIQHFLSRDKDVLSHDTRVL